jgi:anti-sigma B factor antagonist
LKSNAQLLKIQKADEGRVFHVLGELDIATAATLAEALAPAVETEGDLIIDLSELTFMDSSGIKTLIETARKLEGKGGLILRSAGEPIRRVLALTQLDRIPNLTIVDG